MSDWISCRKSLPEEDEDFTQYLLTLTNGRMAVAYVCYPFANEVLPQWYGEGDTEFDHSEVGYWQRLPEPPKC